jgi:hypothetical protein
MIVISYEKSNKYIAYPFNGSVFKPFLLKNSGLLVQSLVRIVFSLKALIMSLQ